MNNQKGRERVLVFDDDQAILHLLERVLSREGYRVTAIDSRHEVGSLMPTEHFDLLIMDVGRHSRNGYKLMSMIGETGLETPVVVMTSYPVEEVVSFAREHAQGYLEKPFDLHEFLATVRSALQEAAMSTRRVSREGHLIKTDRWT